MITIYDDKLVSEEAIAKVDGFSVNIDTRNNETLALASKNEKPVQLKVIISKSANAKLLLYALNRVDICFEIAENAVVNIVAILGQNNSYSFNNQNNSDIHFSRIILNESNEALAVNLLGENANVNVDALAIGNNMAISFKQKINHLAKYTVSSIKNYGCSLEKCSIVFDTTGYIKKGMAKCDCRQLSKGVVLSDNSSVLSKPILLIDEYDVKAYHGASIGKMSDEDLFYLMSRGLSKNEAFRLLLQGIVDPFIAGIFMENYQVEIRALINQMI